MAWGAFGPNAAAVRLDDALRNGETKAGAAAQWAIARLAAGTGRVAAIEPVEDARQVVGRDAGAGVADGHKHRLAIAGPGLQLNLPAGRSVAQGILDEVAQNSADFVRRHP